MQKKAEVRAGLRKKLLDDFNKEGENDNVAAARANKEAKMAEMKERIRALLKQKALETKFGTLSLESFAS